MHIIISADELGLLKHHEKVHKNFHVKESKKKRNSVVLQKGD